MYQKPGRTGPVDFERVAATPEELAEWRRTHNYSPSYRVRCRACGKRLWTSGLSIGSHRRRCPKTIQWWKEEAS
jgi:hypothetical protein